MSSVVLVRLWRGYFYSAALIYPSSRESILEPRGGMRAPALRDTPLVHAVPPHHASGSMLHPSVARAASLSWPLRCVV